MDKRHSDILTSRLEDAYLNGCSHITFEELYHWYGVQKIAALTYRDLEKRWQELTNGVNGQLMKVEGRAGMFIFAENSIERVNKDIEKFI